MTNTATEFAELILSQYPDAADLAEAAELFTRDARNGRFGEKAQSFQDNLDAEKQSV